YLAADLKTLVERTIHEGAIRNLQNNINETDFLLIHDFRKAQKGFVPFSLQTLESPTKYASILADCPLRLWSG
ncbi:1286_t:CDS:2, partial [Racocetra persica]